VANYDGCFFPGSLPLFEFVYVLLSLIWPIKEYSLSLSLSLHVSLRQIRYVSRRGYNTQPIQIRGWAMVSRKDYIPGFVIQVLYSLHTCSV